MQEQQDKREVAIVVLTSLYIAFQLIADVGATKLSEIMGVIIPTGSLVFAVTFTLRDLIHKRLGKRVAVMTIFMAATANVLMAAILYLFARLRPASFYTLNEPWAQIMAFVPAITIGSIVAELISELCDTEVFEFWTKKLCKLPQWTAVLASNVVAIPVDSVVFALMAFVILPPLFGGQAVSLAEAFGLTLGQVIFKAVVSLLSAPGIYMIRKA